MRRGMRQRREMCSSPRLFNKVGGFDSRRLHLLNQQSDNDLGNRLRRGSIPGSVQKTVIVVYRQSPFLLLHRRSITLLPAAQLSGRAHPIFLLWPAQCLQSA